jgi:ribosomal protein S27E
MTEMRIMCSVCRNLFPYYRNVHGEEVVCPTCGHVVYKPEKKR